MATKTVQIVLTSCTAATAAFFAGKYYERNVLLRSANIPARPALPIYGSVPARLDYEPQIVLTPYSSALDTLRNFGKNLLPFGSVKAASPVEQTPLPKFNEMIDPNASRIAQIMKYGVPRLDGIIPYSDYVVCYDKRSRVANWVFEHLTENSVKKNDKVDRSKCNFMESDQIHPYFKSRNLDYKGSGFDRGHLAAAGNHKSCQKHVEETFYLTNIAPQVGKGFNRDSWNRLEKHVRHLTKTYPNVYCCTGPLFIPRKDPDGKMYVKYQVIGANHVAVPTHFYKVVVGEKKDGSLDMECYVMQNAVIDDSISLKSFQVPPELVERSSGLLFFDRISRDRLHTINGKKTN